MIEYFSYFKAFHIIGFVSWFAALFYLVRIFVYHAESKSKPKELKSDWIKQFSLMEVRAYKIIATPAMVITWLFGSLMLFASPSLMYESWLQLKIFLVFLLSLYHFYCKYLINKQYNKDSVLSSFQFRLLNEFPTIFLVAIVFLAVLKNLLNFGYLLLGILLFGAALYFSARIYKNYRHGKR